MNNLRIGLKKQPIFKTNNLSCKIPFAFATIALLKKAWADDTINNDVWNYIWLTQHVKDVVQCEKVSHQSFFSLLLANLQTTRN